MIKKIFISAGHGGSDPGAVANNLIEKNLNLVVSLKLKELLLSVGFEVMMVREDDSFVSLSDRAAMSNGWGADLYIAIHHNAGGGDGAEVIHSIYHGTGYEVAHFIAQEFESSGQNIRNIYAREGAHGDYYAEIREPIAPAIITEYAFLDSKDCEAVDTIEELHTEAYAIFKGICTCFGIAIPRPTSNISTTLGILSKEIAIDPGYWVTNAVRGGVCDGELVATIFRRFADRIEKGRLR